MKILVYSDLHNEFEPFAPVLETLRTVDLIVLAGDIDVKRRGVEWASSWAELSVQTPIIMVAGNHEFYGEHFDDGLIKLRDAVKGSRIHFLENDEYILDGVRFLGCTLWTDFKLNGASSAGRWVIEDIRNAMTDFKKIRAKNYRKLHPTDTVVRHEASRAWLESKLDEPFGGPTVVVTHHAPSSLSIPDEFADEYGSAAYASDLSAMMGSQIALWIHGHVHEACDYESNGTRVVCNPRGYAPKYLNEGFDPSFIVNLDAPGL
jgi:Icc-related predicted phosphoesterase